MNQQIDVDILDAGGEARPAHARWLICDNGMTVADGAAHYYKDSGSIEWVGPPPPLPLYASVVLEIDRAVTLRLMRNSGSQS